MSTTLRGIGIDVSRGPNWLFLRLEPQAMANAQPLVDELWGVVSKHFVYRVVLEFSPKFGQLTPEWIEQLDEFRARLEEHDGAVRVCGLSRECAGRLEQQAAASKTRSRLTSHESVAAALFGADRAHNKLPEPHHTAKATETVTQDTAYEALRVH